MSNGKGVCILYTGGTLGMVPSAQGYVPAPDLGRLMAARMPELRAEGMPRHELVEYGPPMDSANATRRFWYELSERIESLQGDYDGFVVIHGTDTLAYTASALSFLLARMDKPVVLTGAQIPLYEIRNDAQANLLAAILVASLGRVSGASVVFGRRLLRANRTTKIRSTALDAFESPGFPALAALGTEIRFRDLKEAPPAVPASWFERPAYRPQSIAVVPVYPGIPPGVIQALVDTGLQGLILECYGMGNAPHADTALLGAIRAAVESGTVIVAISQCLEGSVSLRAYAAGSALADCGVIGGFDMTREAAFAKLHYLFARGLAPQEVARRMPENLRGELTPPRDGPGPGPAPGPTPGLTPER